MDEPPPGRRRQHRHERHQLARRHPPATRRGRDRHRRRDRQHQPPPHRHPTTDTTRRPDVSIPITSDHFCVSADEPAVRLQLLTRLLEQLTDTVITVTTPARPDGITLTV